MGRSVQVLDYGGLSRPGRGISALDSEDQESGSGSQIQKLIPLLATN